MTSRNGMGEDMEEIASGNGYEARETTDYQQPTSEQAQQPQTSEVV